MAKSLCILGSTGSIGTQALKVARNLNLKIDALTANTNVNLLAQQIREFKPKYAVISDVSKYNDLKVLVADLDVEILAGSSGINEISAVSSADILLNSLVGMVGLIPTLEGIKSKKTIALANKETLVAGGYLVTNLAIQKNVSILPVDSEHSAIFQCISGNDNKIKKIILTASGGPFFGKKKDDLLYVKRKDALKHPNWSMGNKISIDSATLMNKGLELIEAVWLFSVKPEDIEIVVHRQSVIHSAVEFYDNSVIAQLGVPDMAIPIQYAITYPKRLPCDVQSLSLTDFGTLTFEKPDYETFGCLNIAFEAIKIGGIAPCVINSANEQAVELFLDEKIKFLDIERLVYKALENHKNISDYNLEDVLEYDKWAREFVLSHV